MQTAGLGGAARASTPGHPLSYAEFAAALGQPSAVRAAASICARNAPALFVPCHRVLRVGRLARRLRVGARREAQPARSRGRRLRHAAALRRRSPEPRRASESVCVQRISQVYAGGLSRSRAVRRSHLRRMPCTRSPSPRRPRLVLRAAGLRGLASRDSRSADSSASAGPAYRRLSASVPSLTGDRLRRALRLRAPASGHLAPPSARTTHKDHDLHRRNTTVRPLHARAHSRGSCRSPSPCCRASSSARSSALVASLLALTIPLVLEVIVAGPIASGDLAQIAWGSAAHPGARSRSRRSWCGCAAGSCSGPRPRSSTTCARTFYARLQRLPVSFHDRWQSGQLLSRMMQDISMLRRWMAFGVVLLVVNVITIVVGTALLFRWHWLLGTIFLVTLRAALVRRLPVREDVRLARAPEPGPGRRPRDLRRGERARHPRAQGVRPRQARPAEVHQPGRDAAPDRAAQGRRGRLDLVLAGAAARHRVRAVPRRGHLPRPARPAADRRAHRLLRDGDRAALADGVDRLPVLVHCSTPAPRPTASSRCSTRRTRSSIPTAPRRSSGRAASSRSRACTSAIRMPRHHERDLLDGIDLVLRPGETMALVGLTGSGKTTLTTLPARLYDVTEGRVTRRRRRRARPRARPSCARTSAWRSRTRRCSRSRCATTCCSAARSSSRAAPRPRRCCARRSTSRRRASSTTCPTASTRSSARRG